MSLDVYLTSQRCPHCGNAPEGYSSNITHNLGSMAREAGAYQALWRPEEIGITKAAQLIGPIKSCIAQMMTDRPRFEYHNAKNGWGTYDQFLPWLEDYLAACERMPDADVSVSR